MVKIYSLTDCCWIYGQRRSVTSFWGSINGHLHLDSYICDILVTFPKEWCTVSRVQAPSLFESTTACVIKIILAFFCLRTVSCTGCKGEGSNNHHNNHNPVMTRRHTRRNLPRNAYKNSYKRVTMGYNSVYNLRNHIVCIVLLNSLAQKTITNNRTKVHLSASRNSTIQPNTIKCKSSPITGLDRPWGFQEVEAPRFQDSRLMKVVRLSALRTGRLYPLPRRNAWC